MINYSTAPGLQPWDEHNFRAGYAKAHQVVFLHSNQYFPKQALHAVLSAAELQKSARFLAEADGQRYLFTRYAIRKLLELITGTPAASIIFETRKNKKPTFRDVHFNISHSGPHIYIAFSSLPIGIDAEKADPAFDTRLVAENSFAPEEKAIVKNDSSPEQFFTIWTRKEALLKATGEGISDALPEILVVQDVVTRHNVTYHLHTWQHGEYILSAATTQPELPYSFMYFGE